MTTTKMKKNKVAIVVSDSEESFKVKNKLIERIHQSGQLELDEFFPGIVISIGGDGTFLRAFHQYRNRLDEVSFVGIHTGHLGFYTDWLAEEVDELMEILESEQKRINSYPLLEITTEKSDGTKEKHIALNEATIRKSSATWKGEIFISGEFFENFRGDGISISTPTGSTGYNKSIGGAVVHPSIATLQLSEIASLNNRVFRTLGSSLIIGPEEDLSVHITDSEGTILTMDNLEFPCNDLQRAFFKISKKKVSFLAEKDVTFWRRVRTAFIGE
ncbi:MAG: NAD kinase [Streptococcaceae bacterium]|jgi:NAD+ kinase|nr:NAD kinase [Streptococcaceae bacterium]